MCPRSSDPFYLTYFIKWVTTSLTQSILQWQVNMPSRTHESWKLFRPIIAVFLGEKLPDCLDNTPSLIHTSKTYCTNKNKIKRPKWRQQQQKRINRKKQGQTFHRGEAINQSGKRDKYTDNRQIDNRCLISQIDKKKNPKTKKTYRNKNLLLMGWTDYKTISTLLHFL